MNSLSAVYGIISFRFNSRAIRYSQGFLFLIISQLILRESITAFVGAWLLITGTVVLFKYNFFQYKHRIILILLLNLSLMYFAAVKNQETDSLPGLVLLILFSFIVLYYIFEEPHQQAIQEIRYLEPLSKIGRNGTAIVHSVKNKLSNLETCINFLRYDLVPQEEIIHKFDASLLELNETVNGLLAISNAGFDGPDEILQHNLSDLLSGLCILLKQDRVLLEHADLNINIQPHVHASFNKFSFILAFENIIQNALDALQQNGSRGQIDIILDQECLEIRNNGGMIPTCISCPKDCNSCRLYSKIGRTSKTAGTGVGLPQVIDMANQAGWSIKIRGYNGDMTSISFQIV